jgi:hypothetical protein
VLCREKAAIAKERLKAKEFKERLRLQAETAASKAKNVSFAL